MSTTTRRGRLGLRRAGRPFHVRRSMALPASRTVPTTRSITFDSVGVPPALSRVLADAGITTPTPIQAATLPDSLAGRDVLGRGRTGSGKTYAFLLPVLARLAAAPKPR